MNISLQDWIGRTTEAEDILTPRLAQSFRAIFCSHLAEADDLLGIHWCLAPEIAPMDKLQRDGHVATGGFLPPVALPRRMWAGSETQFLAPLRVGDHTKRTSRVTEIVEKTGKTGALCFVKVHHHIENERGPVISEVQTIVYREAATGKVKAVPSPSAVSAHRQAFAVDPVLLFRYSAITFNGHRIHYDAPYTMDVEYYPGLVIHGPIQATLLLNFAAKLGQHSPVKFSFRGVSPATGAQQLQVCAQALSNTAMSVHVENAEGVTTMAGEAKW